MKKSIYFIIVLTTLLLLLTGCKDKKNIIGTWERKEEEIIITYVLKKDGTGSYSETVDEKTTTATFTYVDDNNMLLITFDGEEDVYEYPYTLKDKTLIIHETSDDELIYHKK